MRNKLGQIQGLIGDRANEHRRLHDHFRALLQLDCPEIPEDAKEDLKNAFLAADSHAIKQFTQYYELELDRAKTRHLFG